MLSIPDLSDSSEAKMNPTCLVNNRIHGSNTFEGIDSDIATKILEDAVLCMDGVRDLDLVLHSSDSQNVLDHLGLTSPIVYLSVSQRIQIAQEETLQQLKLAAIDNGSQDQRALLSEIEGRLSTIKTNKEILKLSYSAVDLGLLRGIEIRQEENGPLLVVAVTATTSKCLHVNSLLQAFSNATAELGALIKGKGYIPNLQTSSELKYLEGVWEQSNISNEILETAGSQASNLHLSLDSATFPST